MFDRFLQFLLFECLNPIGNLLGEIELFVKKFYLVTRFLIIIVLFLILYPLSLMTMFTYSNCWIYAINQYIQFNGYIVFRKTKWNIKDWVFWEHALWSADLKTFYTYIPRKRKRFRIIPPLLFLGDIVVMDNKEKPMIHFQHVG